MNTGIRPGRPSEVLPHLRIHRFSDIIAQMKTQQFTNLNEHRGVRHFISTRHAGLSPSPYDSLNIGFRTDDEPRNVLENRRRLAAHTGIPLESFVTGKQVHGTKVAVVTEDMRGLGASDYDSALDATDALVTAAPGVCIVVQVADCVPILLYDPIKHAAGAVHAGWRSTVQGIAVKTVETMIDQFGSRPEDIVAGIGPSIGPCCYEVGPEVVVEIAEAFGGSDGLISRRSDSGKAHLDLWAANRRQLLASGLRGSAIEEASCCTRCNSDLFFSARTSRVTGRFAAGIMLLDEACAECTAVHCSGCRD